MYVYMYVCMYVCIDVRPCVLIFVNGKFLLARPTYVAHTPSGHVCLHTGRMGTRMSVGPSVRITIRPGLGVRTKFRIIARFGSSVVFGGKLMVASRLKFRRWSAGESRD